MTTTAPVIAPTAAAVTPSTKATMPGRLPYFLNYGALRIAKKNQGTNVVAAATTGAPKAQDQKADEARRDDDRAGRQHGHGHRIDEQPVYQPAVFLHDAAVGERHYGQAAAEDEAACVAK